MAVKDKKRRESVWKPLRVTPPSVARLNTGECYCACVCVCAPQLFAAWRKHCQELFQEEQEQLRRHHIPYATHVVVVSVWHMNLPGSCAVANRLGRDTRVMTASPLLQKLRARSAAAQAKRRALIMRRRARHV